MTLDNNIQEDIRKISNVIIKVKEKLNLFLRKWEYSIKIVWEGSKSTDSVGCLDDLVFLSCWLWVSCIMAILKCFK